VKSLKRLDWGLLLAVALALLAAGPFLARPGLPRDTDAELHVFRAAEIAACWQQGALYPRWAPDFYYGYGYPIFNYYAPLTYHLASLFALIPGVGIVAGVRGVFVLTFLLGGVGTYLLTREMGGAAAGGLAAAAFLFAPYVLFVDPHARGDLAEQFAVGLLPLALFALRRLVAGGGSGALLGAAILTAALIASHNLLGMVGLVVLVAALIWQALAESDRRGVGRGALGLGLGLALSAFFWLPLFAELDQVRLTVVGGGHFDFRNHFVSMGELFAPSRLLDLGAVAPRYRFNLGLPQWLLAAAGTGLVVWRGHRKQSAVLFFALLAAGFAFLMTPASRWFWEAVPVLAYLQFPWRLLGPTSLALAVCAGMAAGALPLARWRPVALAAGLLVVLVLALPLMYPPSWGPCFGDTSPLGIVRFELEGKVLGTTSTGDFLPCLVKTDLHPEQSLIDSYEGAGPVDKVNRATLPKGTRVDVLEHGPLHDRFLVRGEDPFVFRLYTLLFPGWRAYVDGEEVEIKPGNPEGFITFWLEPGEHEVLVRFEDTPPRRAGWAVSAAGLAGLFGSALFFCVRRRRLANLTSRSNKGLHNGLLEERALEGQGRGARAELTTTALAAVAGVTVLFVLTKLLLVDPHPNWLRYTSPPGEAWAAQVEQQAVLGQGEVALLGFDLPQRRVRSGEELTVVLYWQALRSLETNYQSFVHLTHPAAVSWGQSDSLNPGGLPTTRWPLDRYVWEVHRLPVQPGTPPGTYALEAGLYTLVDGHRLAVSNDDGEVTGETVVLDAAVEVLPPRRPPRVDELGLDQTLEWDYGDEVTLLGYVRSSAAVEAPGFLHFTLFWQARRNHPADLTINAVVLDSQGETVAEASGAPAGGRYPTSRWSRREVVRDPYAFWLDENFLAGPYTVAVVVHRGGEPLVPDGAGRSLVELFTVEVQ